MLEPHGLFVISFLTCMPFSHPVVSKETILVNYFLIPERHSEIIDPAHKMVAPNHFLLPKTSRI